MGLVHVYLLIYNQNQSFIEVNIQLSSLYPMDPRMLLGHPKRNGALGTLLGAAGAGPRNPDDGSRLLGDLGVWFQFGALKQPTQIH